MKRASKMDTPVRHRVILYIHKQVGQRKKGDKQLSTYLETMFNKNNDYGEVTVADVMTEEQLANGTWNLI